MVIHPWLIHSFSNTAFLGRLWRQPLSQIGHPSRVFFFVFVYVQFPFQAHVQNVRVGQWSSWLDSVWGCAPEMEADWRFQASFFFAGALPPTSGVPTKRGSAPQPKLPFAEMNLSFFIFPCWCLKGIKFTGNRFLILPRRGKG